MSTPRPPSHHPHAPPPPGRPPTVRTIGGPDPDLDDEASARRKINRAIARWGLGLSVLFVAIGLVWGALTLRQRGGATVDTSDWPNTLGMVISCEEGVAVEGERRTHTRVEYRYDVEGRRYTSNTVSFDNPRNFPCTDYPLGKGVRVYYAPWRPSLATLTHEGGRNLPEQLGGALLCVLVGLVLGVTQVGILVGPTWVRRPED